MQIKKILSTIVIVIIFIVSNNSIASANSTVLNDSILLSNDSIAASVTIKYSMKDYCMNSLYCTGNKKIVPYRVWVERNGGYAGYINTDSHYASNTHYVVTYWGYIRKGPFAPTTIIIEDE